MKTETNIVVFLHSLVLIANLYPFGTWNRKVSILSDIDNMILMNKGWP